MKYFSKRSVTCTVIALILLFTSTTFTSCKKETLQTSSDPIVSATSEPPKTRGYSAYISLNNFIYYNQLNSGCTNNTYKQNGCLPASCLMGAHIMTPNIPSSMSIPPPAVTPANFTTFCSGMGTSSSGTNINNGYIYLKNNYYSSQSAPYSQPNTTTGRSNTISKMKTYLSSNHPTVALIRYNLSAKVPSTTASGLHFVLLVGIEETTAGVGNIYYYDPNNTSGIMKVYSLSAFLNAMKSIPSGNYNLLRIGN